MLLPHPQPHPSLFPPQILKLPHPHPFPPPKPPLPHRQNKMMIQRKLPHPQSLEGALLHPQEVAVKSLIKASKSLFMVYTMSGGLPCFWKNKKFFSDRGFRRILCVYGGTALRDMLRYIEDSRWENADNDILKQTQKIVEMASQDDKVGG